MYRARGTSKEGVGIVQSGVTGRVVQLVIVECLWVMKRALGGKQIHRGARDALH